MSDGQASGGAARPRVRRIWQEDSRTLGIDWTDGQVDHYDVVTLRRLCPCARCVDEVTGARILGPGDVPDTVRPTRIQSVGRYALKITFDDGHSTGLYSFAFLHDRYAEASARSADA